jgi:hypothetical protein
MMARIYAENTKVSVQESIDAIRTTVGKHDGAQFFYALGEDEALVAFSKEARQVRFYISLAGKGEQERKAALRALLLVIKAKLEAVAAGVSVFEDEFLANITLPNGNLVGREVRRALAVAYEGGEMPRLLPDYSA